MRIKHWFYTLPLRLRSIFSRDRVEQELDEELRYHLDRQIEENIAKGMTDEEARYAALRALGGVERRKEECRDMRRVGLIEDLAQDLRYGLRTLRKSPGFTAHEEPLSALSWRRPPPTSFQDRVRDSRVALQAGINQPRLIARLRP